MIAVGAKCEHVEGVSSMGPGSSSGPGSDSAGVHHRADARLKLVGDISCFPTSGGWSYLATIPDSCSKGLIRYTIARHMRGSLAVEAVAVAHRAGLIAGKVIMHTDRESQCHSKTHRNERRLHLAVNYQAPTETRRTWQGRVATTA